MRLRMIIRGFVPQMASMSGLRLASGMRASKISHTASTSFTSASIIRRVLVMWPGYHWIFMRSSIVQRSDPSKVPRAALAAAWEQNAQHLADDL